VASIPCSTASSRAAGAAPTSCGQSAARLGAIAQRRERIAPALVDAGDAFERVERPVVEIGPVLAADAHELVDHGAERAAAAAQRGIAAFGLAATRPILARALAGAAPILVARAPLVIAGAAAVVGLAGAVFAAIAPEILPKILAVAAAPPLVEAAGAPAVAARLPPILHAILAAILHAVLPAILILTLAQILSFILGLILPAALPAVLALTLGIAGAPPIVEARLAALAVVVIAVMMPAAGVGARGHAHHQHRRKQHGRLEHGSRPRWSSAMTTREAALGSAPDSVRSLPHSSARGAFLPSPGTRCAHMRLTRAFAGATTIQHAPFGAPPAPRFGVSEG
jgi:hypothetical protein